LEIEELIAHIAIYLGIGIAAFKVAKHASTPERRLFGTVVLFTRIGVKIKAVTGVVFSALVLSYVYFWFAGAVVAVAQRERGAVRELALQPLELAPA
jgi:hypothetical protein